jgi:hypothetical protein
MNAENEFTPEEQAAFDNVVKWFPGTKTEALEPHTPESRRRFKELVDAQTAAFERRGILEEADEVLAEDAQSSWRAIDLRNHLFGRIVDEPSVLVRDDAKALFYGGKRNALFGAYESGKTFVALLATQECLEGGGTVVWIDFEDSPRSLAGRLLALGVNEDLILERFRYIQPTEPLNAATELDLRVELHGTDLVVIDGVNEAMAAASLDPNKNPDVARWYMTSPRLAIEAGATLLTLDHVAKHPEAQRGAVGGAHKIAAIDGAAYKVDAAVPFGRGSRGVVSFRLEKDRPGWIRGDHPGKAPIVAKIVFDATDPEGSISTAVSAPKFGEETWRPTALMQRISTFLEAQAAPASQRQILDGVSGKRDYKIQALAALVADGYLTREDGPKGAILYTSAKPYREGSE